MKRTMILVLCLLVLLAPLGAQAEDAVAPLDDQAEIYYHSVWVCLEKWAAVDHSHYWAIATAFNEWYDGGSAWRLYIAVRATGAGDVWPQFYAYCQHYRALPNARRMALPLLAQRAPLELAQGRSR